MSRVPATNNESFGEKREGDQVGSVQNTENENPVVRHDDVQVSEVADQSRVQEKRPMQKLPANEGSKEHPSGSTKQAGRAKTSPKRDLVPLRRIYSVLDTRSRTILLLCASCAILAGGTLPFFVLLLGDSIRTFGETEDEDERTEKIQLAALFFLLLGIYTMILNYIWLRGFIVIGDRVLKVLQIKYFKAIVHQEVEWFDRHNSAQLTTQIASSLEDIKAGLGERLGRYIYYLPNILGIAHRSPSWIPFSTGFSVNGTFGHHCQSPHREGNATDDVLHQKGVRKGRWCC